MSRTEHLAAGEPPPTPDRVASLDDEELLGLGLFDSMDIESIRPLLATCPVRAVAPGEQLIAGGRPNQFLYLILSGRLSVRLASAEGAAITEVGAGESVGELSVVDRQPTSAFVVAEEESRVLAIDEQLLWILVNSSHAVSTNLLFTLARRMRYGNKLLFESRERLEHYRFHATVDALTGLFNRHWLGNMLPRQMHRFRQGQEPLSLLMIDIDHFKAFNDRHGHVAGDRALVVVASTIRDALRPADMAVRYGGEEFLALLPDCSLSGARTVAERLRTAVASTRSDPGPDSPLPPVTVSVGAAEQTAHVTMDGFVAAADAALYRAKSAGRNRVAV